MPLKSDPQAEQVYDLEAEINGSWTWSSATTKNLEALLLTVCKYYGVEAPKFKVVNTKEVAETAYYAEELIVLNRRREGANGMVLLHEAAHYLVDCFYADVENHGPEFVAIYMHLLDEYRYLPHRCFRMMAKIHRLRIGRRYRPIAFKNRGV